MSELNSVFSRNFENTTKMLTYICNRQRIFDFYDGHYLNTLFQPNYYEPPGSTILINSYNFNIYSDILNYETKCSRINKYFVKDDQYHCNLQCRNFDFPRNLKKKEFNSSIKKIKYQQNQKRGFRRNY